MKVVKIIILGLVLLTASTTGNPMAQAQTESQHKIVVLADTSGTNWGYEDFEALKEQFMVELARLQENYFYAFSSVDVIETATGRLIWSGSINEIQSPRGAALKAAITAVKTNCNNLPRTFQTLDHHLKFIDGRQFSDIKIFVISNLYNTPVPCGKETRIIYPSLAPKDVDLNQILTQRPEISSVIFFGAHEAQVKVWGDALPDVVAWQQAGEGRIFRLYNVSQSIAALNQGLEGMNP